MTTMRTRIVRLTIASALAMGAGAVTATAADAATAESASLTMTSDEGDFIGLGQQYSYSTSANDAFNSTAFANGSVVQVGMTSASGDFWSLDFAGPAGQSLRTGTYNDATRYPFHGEGPGLSVSGQGRGCNALTGSFTVSEITFGPNDYLQSFHATFEQHCEGSEPALRGEIDVVNPPAPQPLQIGSSIDSRGTADRTTGTATVSGTVTCNQPTSVFVSGTLTQRANRSALSVGSFFVQVHCSEVPTAWQATTPSGTGVPFNPGSATLDVTASAFDPAYGQQLSVNQTDQVRLTR